MPIPDIIKRFRERFNYSPYGIFDGKELKFQEYVPFTEENVESFILEVQVDREAEIVAGIEGMGGDVSIITERRIERIGMDPLDWKTNEVDEQPSDYHYKDGYNAALDDIATKITNKEI